MLTDVSLNLGCGAAILGGWVNVDIEKMPGVEMVADALDLPCDGESIDCVRSSHLVEHFTVSELDQYARECWRVLKPGGSVEVIAPDMDGLVEMYHARKHQESIDVSDIPMSPLEWLNNALFARHLHPTDYHRQGIYEEKLRKVFHRFTLHQFEHHNRISDCPEIRMTCSKTAVPLASVCLSTRNKAKCLDLTLASIASQRPPFPFEVIVVDDGSKDNTRQVCKRHGVRYFYMANPRYRNPATARNVAYRAARGTVIIPQSDDIIHISQDAIAKLASEIKAGEFLLAQTHNYQYKDGKPVRFIQQYCGPKWRVPYFFLGAVFRKDLYSIGGCDEDFVEPCFDDNWLSDCLIHGAGLQPRYVDDVLCHHQSHSFGQGETRSEGYEKGTHSKEHLSRELYECKVEEARRTGVYCSSGGPWPLDTTKRSVVSRDVASQARVIGVENDGVIPRCMHFFWAGSSMSWLRYMTVCSFRRLNPTWRIIVHRMKTGLASKGWSSSEALDSDIYGGPNYLEGLHGLGVIFQDWSPTDNAPMAPSHASDLFQWKTLAMEGGFYADMDILWVRPIPYDDLSKQEAVFCLSDGFMAIGFLACSPGNPIFQRISVTAIENYTAQKYQSTGAEAIYRMAGVWPSWGSFNRPGDLAIKWIREQYPAMALTVLPQETIYPFNYKSTAMIFERVSPLPPRCFGIHWFGGNQLSQRWNCELTGDNFSRYRNTYTIEAQKLL